MKAICVQIFLFLSVAGFAQDTNALVLTEDAKYFDFWEGTLQVINGNGTIHTASYFKVKRSVTLQHLKKSGSLALIKQHR
jgi:hypothetical protein